MKHHPNTNAPYALHLSLFLSLCLKLLSEVPCAIKPVSEGDQSTACNGTFVDRPICVGDQNEVLEKSQLEAIASSSEIHNILNDEKLQKFILAIDSSPDPETLIKLWKMKHFAFSVARYHPSSTLRPNSHRWRRERHVYV
ncbi:uncharacterized protein LOC101208978 isoform X4 [Cucumis sativus]|uniref:uncharacterized protein LOC101208978 isoform X4 n=1 Tax=Cucumis sativus TaxID=3659 RepID=UPI0012F519D8|nr:uncharacterized protein LOC101208978 isoform X4 [Cucumis sativus]